MGCSASVQVQKQNDENGNTNGKKTKPPPLIMPAVNADFLNTEEGERETMVEIMKEKEVENISGEGEERSDPDGAASNLESNPDAQEDEEVRDDFDPTKNPMTRKNLSSLKKHATQETLEFVYKNSSSSSPNHTGGTFGLITAGTPNTSRWTQRRASGVPPPPRALKDSDFLSKYASGSRRPSNMMEEEEGEEDKEGIDTKS
ncbi:uncharacterized protein LOC100183828 [Ciona intestinalis]